eukprot:gene10349-8285_t
MVGSPFPASKSSKQQTAGTAAGPAAADSHARWGPLGKTGVGLRGHRYVTASLGEHGVGALEAQGEVMHRGSTPLPAARTQAISRSINVSRSYDGGSFHCTWNHLQVGISLSLEPPPGRHFTVPRTPSREVTALSVRFKNMPGWEGSTPPWRGGEEGNLSRPASGREGEIGRSSRQGYFDLASSGMPGYPPEAPPSPPFQRRLGNYSEAGSNTAGSENAASSLSHRLSNDSFGPGHVQKDSETMWTAGSSVYCGPSWTKSDQGEQRAGQKHSQGWEYEDTDHPPPQGYHLSPESSPYDASAPYETYQKSRGEHGDGA